MRRRLVVTALLLGGLFAGAGPARAQTPACTISIADTQAAQGSILIVAGSHFPTTPEAVPIVIDDGARPAGVALVRPDGTFAEPINVPSDLVVGPHTISASCGKVTIAVVKPQPARARHDDGDDAIAIAAAGVAAVVIALVLTARRRRAQRVMA